MTNNKLKITNKNAVPAGRQGFTLFELLVSISIIAILVAVATASFSAAQKKARDARRTEDLGSIQKAAEQYYMLNDSSYPNGLCSAGTAWTVGTQVVLEAFPLDPRGVGYTLGVPCTGAGYCLCGVMEGQKGNSTNAACGFTGVGGTGSYYCVKNQQ